MNRTFHIAMTVLLWGCGVFSFAQTTTPPPTEQKPSPPAASSDKKQGPPSKPTAADGPIEILTDTMGVDFKPYLQQVVLPTVRKNWYNWIPESARAPLMKKGKVTIEFAILKDGTVAGMRLVSTSGDVALDRGAWGGITASNPFPPLPIEFGGNFLGLRFAFYYNPDRSDLTGSATPKGPSGAPPVDRGSASATETIVRLSEILIGTPQPYDPAQVAEAQRKAEQVRAAIGRGGTFADIARANSQGPTAAQGGDLGCFSHGNLARTLDELVFQMKVGDVSDVVRTKQGFVILEVSNRGADSCADLELLKHYNPDKADLTVGPLPTGQSSESKSGIKVSISLPGDVKVPIGGSQKLMPTVTGSTKAAVKWSVTGLGCSGSDCGLMSGDLYLAPKVLPSPPSITLTATSEADSTASASVRVQLVQSVPSH